MTKTYKSKTEERISQIREEEEIRAKIKAEIEDEQSSGKNKTTAGLLALFLGGFGVHKFYLGNIGMGIFYILFCWTYLPALFSLIEGVILLTMSNKDFDKKYNNK